MTLLPVTDDRVETHVVIDDPETGPKARKAIHFQEWWIRHKAAPAPHGFASVGAEQADRAARPCADAIAGADAVLLAPSNPVVSIGALLDVPGAAGRAARDAGAGRRAVADRRRAPAARDGRRLPGRDRRARPAREAVGRHYGARADGGLLDGWLVHTGDAADVPGVEVRAVPLLMTDVAATAEMARRALELCRGRAVG